MANNSSKTKFDKMKYEVASEIGVNLKQGYNGDLASRDAGRIGGNIVKGFRILYRQCYTSNNSNRVTEKGLFLRPFLKNSKED